jgi:hypothetical protein
MPLLKGKKNIGKNITKLKVDNMKKSKAMGANGVKRPMKQILAMVLSKAGVKKNELKHSKMHEKKESMSMKLKEKKM